MDRERTHRGRGGGVATGVERAKAEGFLDERGDEGPAAHVLGLILHPDDLLGRTQVCVQLGEGGGVEGVELFDADDRSRGVLAGSAFGVELVEDLAGAEQQALGLRGRGGVWEDGLEASAGEFC